MSAAVLIKAVEVEGFGGGGVVAAACGDVQVDGVFDGRDDGGADGGQVGGPAAGAAGRGVFAESHVPDVVVRLNGPVLAGQAGQVLSGGAGAGQAGDGVDGLAGGLAGSGVLPPTGDLGDLAGPGEVQAADLGGAQGLGGAVGGGGRVGGQAGRGRAAGARGGRAWPEQGRGEGSRVKPVQDHPDRLLIRCPVPAGDRIPWSSQAGQVRLAGSSGPLPDRGEPIIPGGGKSADRDRDPAGQRGNPPLW